MKLKLSLICTMLILVLCIGAVSAADIDNENDSNSIISTSNPIDLDVDDNEFDYVDNDMMLNDSSSSSVLGVSEDENLVGDGEKVDIVVNIPKVIYYYAGYWDMDMPKMYSVTTGPSSGIDLKPSDNLQDFALVNWMDGSTSTFYIYVMNEIEVGEYGLDITYAGDDTYNPLDLHVTILASPFNIAVSSSSDSITVTVDGSESSVTGDFKISLNDDEKGNITLNSDKQSLTISNLPAGVYDVLVNYTNGNYADMTYETTATIFAPAQWVVPGFDNKNSGNTEYTRLNNAYVVWNSTVNNPISSVVIDGEGNIYLADDSNVNIFYCNGTLKATSQGGSRGAISLMDNHYVLYVRPWSNIVAFDISDYSGIGTRDSRIQFYTNSKYAPIVGPDGTIYLSVYFDNGGMPNQGKYLTAIGVDKESNQFTYNNVVVNSQPISSPVLDDSGILWVTTETGLYVVDTSSYGIVSSYPNLGTVGRPVIDENNIVYVFGKDNTINALNIKGPLWNITVNNGIGSVMTIDNENSLLYSVDNSGTLYSYNTEEKGNEVEIYNIDANATSMIVDGNGILYIADSKGMIWAFQNEKLLWNIELNSEIKGSLAMDKNGVIYAVTADTIYALGYKNDTDLSLEVEDNFTTLDEITITASINSTFDGENITFTIKSDNGYENTTNKSIDNGKAILNIANLKEGTYNVTASYAGNTYYAEASIDDNFTVSKIIPELSVNINNANVFENATITVTSTNCEGNVTVKVGEETFKDVVIGEELILPLLPVGIYDVTVTYAEDDVYTEAVNDTEKLEITKVMTEIIIDSEKNYTVFDDINIEVSTNAVGELNYDLYLIYEYSGNMKYIMINSSSVPIDSGNAKIELDKLPAGLYEILVWYDGSEDYTPDFNIAYLNVTKVESELDFEINIEDLAITITLPENATGNIFLDVDGIGYYAPIKDGEAVINIPELKPGTYEAKLNYPGDENYNNASAIFNIEVPELQDPELEVSVDETEITVNINENATGVIIVSIGDISFVYDAEDAPITIDVSEYLDAGKYDVTVEYIGDENFTEASANGTVTVPEVELKDPELKVSVKDTEIIVTIDKDATGIIIVSVGDNDYVADAADAPITIDVSNLEPDTYDVEVIYLGDENFTEAKANATVTVPEEPVVEPKDPELKLNIQNTTIAVSINENATGDVIITVGDISFVQDASELTPIDVSEYLSSGKYSVTVRYVGDENFEESAVIGGSVTVPEEPVVEPKDPNLKATATNTTISVSVDKDATGNVLVDVDGQGYYAPVKDGKASVNVIGLDEGEYKATVTYVGDEIYKAVNTTVTVTVPKKEDPTPEPVDPKAEIEITNATVSITAPKDATGYLLVDVDGTGYYAPIKDGKATIDLPELEAGNHTITAAYTGDNKYTQANKTETITIDEEIETIIAEDLTKVEKAPERFEAKFTDADGKALANTDVTFTINGQTYTRTTDVNGETSIAINLIAGNYTITVNNPVTKETKEYKITVLSRFAENKDLTKYFRNASQFIVKILDDNGNPAKEGEIVTFNINGVFYNRTADATGHVQLNINLQPGDYIITSQYKGCEVSNKVKVLPILTGKDLTKKYGEKDVFEATLVDGQGKPYANQEISFNINGVFYVRTTDSNGVAKLNINLQPGEYIITSTYGQTATSNKVTVTA